MQSCSCHQLCPDASHPTHPSYTIITMRPPPQVKITVEAKEKSMVDHDVMKLDVKRLRDMLAMYADEVFSQENRKFQMTMSMQERKQEIEVHR